MSIIRDFARIKHHTITTIGATFSIPPQEDFTLGLGTTQSWSPTDLYVSEIGVNETDNKAFIRIGNSINEFSFTGGTSSIPNLEQVLQTGNDGGTYSIILNNQNSNQQLYIGADEFDSPQDFILYQEDLGLGSGTQIRVLDTSVGSGSLRISSNTAAINLNNISSTMSTSFGLGDKIFTMGINELGGTHSINKNTRFETNIITSNNTPLDITISPQSNITMLNVSVLGISNTNTYGGKLYSVYRGSTQISSTDKVEKTTFSSATSDIIFNSGNYKVRLTGEVSTTITWYISGEIIRQG